ncbi:MAG: hypothetical protein ACI89X_002972 [Planctomycetota bacterium]|jgi:hypothetical protein
MDTKWRRVAVLATCDSGNYCRYWHILPLEPDRLFAAGFDTILDCALKRRVRLPMILIDQ